MFFSSNGSTTLKDTFTTICPLEIALLNLTSQSVIISALAAEDGFVLGYMWRHAAFS